VRWRVVPNGVPLDERRQDRDCSTNGDDPSIKLICLGNLTRRKGAYDLIAAVEKAAGQGVRARLSLAGGETAPGQRREIEQRVAESPCASQMHLLGLVHGEEKRTAFNEAECVVLPSYAEGLPMALLEGMAAGLPAIATRIGSIPALVDDGVEGLLISAGDVDALADSICRLARDPVLRRRMGRNARDRVERDFSQRAMAERVFQIYQVAIAGKTSPVDEVNLQTNAIRA
jgi:glycosyltransferase involved in cell wall biosynthesis